MAELTKILIIEDSEEDQEFYRRALLRGFHEPFQSFWAEDGATACKLVEQCSPDVILLDYQLPDLDGLEVINTLSQVLPEGAVPPIIMMTGQGREKIAVEAMKLGISDYLVKGEVTAEQLNHSIRLALKQAKLKSILAASEQRFRTSVDTMLDCFGTYACVRNESGVIVRFRTEYINAAAAQRANVHLHEEGTDFQVFEPPAWTEELFREYCQLIETGIPLCKEVLIYEKDDPEVIERAYDLRASKLDDGFVAVWRDITGKKRAELERLELLRKEKEARAEAEAANRAKDEFVAMVTHDLRTPLNSILGWTQMLRRKPTPEKLERAVEIIERSAGQQLGLINDLLDMSRALNGTMALNYGPLNAIELCNMSLSTVYPNVKAKELQLAYRVNNQSLAIEDSRDLLECFPQEQILFFGDSNRLAQVLGNLLVNAVKFTPKGGQITLTISWSEDELCISVADNGKGIEPELLPDIFERFRQGDHAEKSQGLGLGLAIAQNIVKLHGGDIWAESDGLGSGAQISLKLPLRPQPGLAPTT